jgi:tetratricopeptide (TPR) repeat protein
MTMRPLTAPVSPAHDATLPERAAFADCGPGQNFCPLRASTPAMPRHARAISFLAALGSSLAACLADPGDPIAPDETETAWSSEPVIADPRSPEALAPDVGDLGSAPVMRDTSPRDVAAPRATEAGPDTARFDEAMAAREAGDPAAMKQALLQLVRDHPHSPLIPHAYLAFGDHMFEEGRMVTARNFYDRAASFPGSTTAYARYKIAWCHLNEGDDTEALTAFVAAVRAGLELGPQGTAIAQASLRDSVLPFARVGRLDRAPAFYHRLVPDPADLEPVLLHLAEAARAEGREDELRAACRSHDSPPWCRAP